MNDDRISGDALRTLTTFKGYSEMELEMLANSLSRREVKDGEAICAQGEEGQSCFILLEGAVKVQRAIERLEVRTMGTLFPGAIFGQLSLIDSKPRLGTCRAIGRVVVAELDRDAFLYLLREGSQFAITFQVEVARALIRQLRQGNQTLSELEGSSTPTEGLTDWLETIIADRQGQAYA